MSFSSSMRCTSALRPILTVELRQHTSSYDANPLPLIERALALF